jgi:hypothetical protein
VMPSPFATKWRSWALGLCGFGSAVAAAWAINRAAPGVSNLFAPRHLVLILAIVLLLFAGRFLRGE